MKSAKAFEAQSEYRTKLIQSTLAVSFYMTVSIGLVFLNRIILTDKEQKAGGLFISWFQFIVAYVIIVIITNLFPNVPLLNLFPPLHYDFKIILKVLPVSVTFLCMMGFNNKCLEYVTVSEYQIVRSLTILFNILLSYFVLKQTTSFMACLACGGVVVGFFLGIEGDVNLTIKGALFGVTSSFFVALYSIVVKRTIGLLDNNEYLLIEYNTPIAIVLLTPIVWYTGELDVVFDNPSFKFWFMQLLAGVVGFIINIAIFLNIKYTTPLTHNLSGTVKACLQTLLALVIFPTSEKMPPMKLLGTIFVIGFSAFYAYVRKREMKKEITQTHETKDNEIQDIEQQENLFPPIIETDEQQKEQI